MVDIENEPLVSIVGNTQFLFLGRFIFSHPGGRNCVKVRGVSQRHKPTVDDAVLVTGVGSSNQESFLINK